MHITNIRKPYFFLFFFPLFFLSTSCVCTTHIKDLTTKDEEIKTIKLDLQYKGKMIPDLLDRLSMKDQEIGELTDEVHTITDLLDRLSMKDQEIGELTDEVHTITGLLDRLSMKDQEIGKLTDELHADRETIEELKSDIEKLREVDVQTEEKKQKLITALKKRS